MKTSLIIFITLLLSAYMPAQNRGADTLTGYIVKANDTITGHVILPYIMVREKKELNKRFDNEDWYMQVKFIDGTGIVNKYLPTEISAYGWNWNDTMKAAFRSINVVVPHKGVFLVKKNLKPFLKLEIEGPVTMYLYYHRENALGSTNYYNDRYLINEQGEMQALRIKAWLGVAYNLTDLESWFEGYPGLTKFNLKNMMAVEVWNLVSGYNQWKKATSH